MIQKLIKKVSEHRKIYNFFTHNLQKDKLIEEMEELMEAISEHEHKRTPKTLDHMHEEMADVFNVLCQFYVSHREVRKWAKFKLKRTLEYIEEQ